MPWTPSEHSCTCFRRRGRKTREFSPAILRYYETSSRMTSKVFAFLSLSVQRNSSSKSRARKTVILQDPKLIASDLRDTSVYPSRQESKDPVDNSSQNRWVTERWITDGTRSVGTASIQYRLPPSICCGYLLSLYASRYPSIAIRRVHKID